MSPERGGSRHRRRGGLFAVALSFLVLPALLPAPATASNWTVRELPPDPLTVVLFGVSCPSTSLCVAVGSNNTVATSTNPAGDASAWNVAHPGGKFVPPSPGPGQYNGDALTGVSCPLPALCVATGPNGRLLVSTKPTGGAAAWDIVELGLEANQLRGVSCASPSMCVAVGYNSKLVSSTNPTGGVAAWRIDQLAEPLDLRGVSCPNVALCVAVDNTGRVVHSTNPTGGAGAWAPSSSPAGYGYLNGISCPSPQLCVTANPGQILTSTDPAAGWKVVHAGTGLPVKGVSCPSVAACAAVDNNADVITSTDPTGGAGAWNFVNVIPAVPAPDGGANGMFAISCPTMSLCVAAGNQSKIIASTDPFAADLVKNSIPREGNPQRPRVVITRHPAKRVNFREGDRRPRKRGRKVGFRFRAVGRAKRFKCRLDRRRLSHCRSPHRYRVGRGRHVFRVFAIGSTGLRGPRATFRFRVGDLVEPQPISTCKPGQESRLGKACVPPR